jgi:hypothetical protein
MKEEDLVRSMLSARVKYYRSITYVLLFLVSVCVLTLAGTIYLPTHSEPAVTTLFISLTSGLFGSLLTIVTQGIQAARRLRSDEELQTIAEEIGMRESARQQALKNDARLEIVKKEEKLKQQQEETNG